MKYLSFDIEATGLKEDDLVIEFGCVPFCAKTQKLEEELSFHTFVQCPSFESLKPKLDKWVIDHNEELIRKAHTEGLPIQDFKEQLSQYLDSPEIRKYFDHKKITLFGKSMSAIDLPFLSRDLGWNFMRKYFEHRQLDLSSVAYQLVDMELLPQECHSGSKLMEFVGLGDVCHTAIEDSVNTAKIYFRLLEKFKKTT